MEIEVGAEVIDRNGKKVGRVSRVLLDTYSGEISKFTVSTQLADEDLFYSPEHVLEATAKKVKLKIAFEQSGLMGIQYGAEVIDKNGKVLGTVDYPVTDTFTGEITKFKVNTKLSDQGLFFSSEDVLEATPNKIKLRIAFD
jgi:sporulation protein YlmC with PRC-barrel domain